jgi:hypothetical protein
VGAGLLLPVVFCAKSFRRFQAGYQCVETEQIYRLSPFQNRDSQYNLSSYALFSINLSDLYLYVSMHPHFCRYLRIALSQPKVYEFHFLSFGLNTPPPTQIANAVAVVLRQNGIRVHIYLDDWLFSSQSENSA